MHVTADTDWIEVEELVTKSYRDFVALGGGEGREPLEVGERNDDIDACAESLGGRLEFATSTGAGPLTSGRLAGRVRRSFRLGQAPVPGSRRARG